MCADRQKKRQTQKERRAGQDSTRQCVVFNLLPPLCKAAHSFASIILPYGKAESVLYKAKFSQKTKINTPQNGGKYNFKFC